MLNNFKGKEWFHRFCDTHGVKARYPRPEVLEMYEKKTFVWKDHLLARFPTPDAIISLITLDHTMSMGSPLAHWDPDKDNIYRVCISPLTQHVEVTHFGIDCLDTPEVGMYTDTSSLPMWMQERIAVLCMTTPHPPTKPVEGVGQRINANTYWLPKYHKESGDEV